MPEPRVKVAERAGAAFLILSSPPVNALSRGLVEELHAAFDDLDRVGGPGVLIIRSELEAFCAGADLKEMRANLANPTFLRAQVETARNLQALFERIEKMPLVTVAEVGGAALGGGLEFALACDLRVAACEAKLGLPEVRLGLVPGAGGTQRLAAVCGQGIAKRLILGAEVIDGNTAAALGVVHWSVPRAELAAFVDGLVGRVSGSPRAALSAAKSCIAAQGDPGRNGYEEELHHTLRLLEEPETRQRVETFLARAGK